jgi:hypothetical protein
LISAAKPPLPCAQRPCHTHLHRPAPPRRPARADAVAPTISLTGSTPVAAVAAAGARTAKVLSGWPTLTAADPVAPGGAAPTVTCLATIDGTEGPVTDGPGGTDFPYGVTAVTCTAADAAGNASPAVSFVVSVVCTAGYSVRTAGGLCLSERPRTACLFRRGIRIPRRRSQAAAPLGACLPPQRPGALF